MLDASTLTDEIIGAQQTNAELLTLFPPPSPVYPTPAARIFPYYTADPGGTNIEQRIQEQPKDTIMVAWSGTRTGRFSRQDATRHEFAAYVRTTGKVSSYFAAFVDGVCNWNGQTLAFRLLTINNRALPPEDMALQRASLLIGQNFAIYDSMQITFALTERGIDNG
jgi:hypothetical protein